jgi:hypothetical protein
MKRLFALLVGINNYLIPRPLKGCLADSQEYEEFLRGRVDRRTHELHLRKLLDEEATRAAIMEGFREHLALAGPDDTALFVFCGHGSQQPSDPEDWKIEPDRMDQTLVCYDSRLCGSDLADRDISRLLGGIAVRGAHVAVILDACHSGSGTQDSAVSEARYAPPRTDAGPAGYPVDSYAVRTGGSRWATAGAGHHVLLAACRSDELAKEVVLRERHRGVFSACLLEALKTCPGRITYKMLLESTAAGVRRHVSRQHPQLEASDAADLDVACLGGAIGALPRQLSVDRDADHGWILNSGALHGVSVSSGAIRLVLFPRGTAPDEMRLPENAVGRAVVSQVLPAFSVVRLEFAAAPAAAGFDALVE